MHRLEERNRLHLRVEPGNSGLQFRLSQFRPPDDRVLFEGSFQPSVQEITHLSRQLLAAIGQTNLFGSGSAGRSVLIDLGVRLFAEFFPPPLQSILRSVSADTLYLLTNEEWASFPWELAHDGEEYLCCRFAMGKMVQEWGRMPFLPPKKASTSPSLLILSNPTGELREAAEEGRTLYAMASSTQTFQVDWVNGCVEKKCLEEWLPQADLLHFSGHGLSSREGSTESGWLLSDGCFDGSLSSSGQGYPTHSPYLIFSNACYSARTETGGKSACQDLSIARRFMTQGCLHFIGSVIEVVDLRGGEFAWNFYERVFRGESIGQALKSARLKSRANGHAEDMAWAPYALFGDPDTGIFGQTAAVPGVRCLLFAECDQEAKNREACEGFGRELIAPLLPLFPEAEWVSWETGLRLLLFPLPSQAVQFALLLQDAVRRRNQEDSDPVQLKVAIASGELLMTQGDSTGILLEVHGLPVNVGENLLRMAHPGQILLEKSVFDNARTILSQTLLSHLGRLVWLDHGPYRLAQLEELLWVCETGEEGHAPLRPPSDSPLAHRVVSSDHESVLGWRPALDQEVPNAPGWILREKLGEGSLGEVWRAGASVGAETRIFKFCFHAERVRFLKREATLFHLLRRVLGDHPNILQVLAVSFDEIPYYIEMEDSHGEDLARWLAHQGGIESVPLPVRIELVARIADALQAAHDAGVIHRDVKPSNILVHGNLGDPDGINIKITDLGIGQVVSRDPLVPMAPSGLTETLSRTEIVSASGTRLYMAPELLTGRPSSIRSDLYSLGVVLYQFLVGDLHQPITGDWQTQIPDPILRGDLQRCLAGETSQRFASAAELANNLRNLQTRRLEAHEIQTLELRRRKRHLLTAWGAGFSAVVALLAVALGYGLLKAKQSERVALIEKENAQREQYYSNIKLAYQAIQSGEIAQAIRLLMDCPVIFRHWEWGRLLLLANRDLETFTEPSGDQVRCIAINPEETLLATGRVSGKISIWSLAEEKIIAELEHNIEPIEDIHFSQDGSRLLAKKSHSLTVWETGSWKRSWSHTSDVTYFSNVALHPSEPLFAVGGGDLNINLCDFKSANPIKKASGTYDYITSLDYNSDGSSMVTVSGARDTIIFDTVSFQEVGRLPTSNADFVSADWSPDGETIATVMGDNRIRLWDAHRLEVMETIPAQGRWITSIGWSPDSRKLCFNTLHSLSIWDREEGRLGWTTGGVGQGARLAAFIRGGSEIIAANDHSGTSTWGLTENRGELAIVGPTDTITDGLFTSNGRHLITISNDDTISVWDATSAEEVRIYNNYLDSESIDLSPDERYLVIGCHQGDIHLMNLTNGTIELACRGHTKRISEIAFSDTVPVFASASDDKSVRLWDSKSGIELACLEGHASQVTALAFLEDGRHLVTGDGTGHLLFWDTQERRETFRTRPHSSSITSVVLSPDGKYLATGSEDHNILFVNPVNGEVTDTLRGHTSVVRAVCFSPDGKRLFSVGEDQSLLVWDVETRREILALECTAGVLALHPDGRTLSAIGDPRQSFLLHTFPWKTEDYPEVEGGDFRARIEAYKRNYWKNHFALRKGKTDLAQTQRKVGVTGHWDFSEGNLRATVGRDLLFWDGVLRGHPREKTRFGSASEFGIAPLPGGDAQVMAYPACSDYEGFHLLPNTFPNVGGKYLNDYTLILDLLVPKDTFEHRRVLLNTNSSNSNQGDLVLSATGGIGVDGVYQGQIEPDRWYRIVAAFELSNPHGPLLTKYVNGTPVGQQRLNSGVDGRWSVADGRRGEGLLLFAGDEYGNSNGYVSCVQFRNYTLSAEEAAFLGSPTAQGIPITEEGILTLTTEEEAESEGSRP